MTRGLDAALTTPLRSSNPNPVWLVEIGTSPILRYTDAKATVTFNGQTYAARAFPEDLPEQRFQDAGELDLKSITIGDVDGDLIALANAGTLDGVRVRIWLTDRTVLEAGGTSKMSNTYICESPDIVEGAVVLNLRPIFACFQHQVPKVDFNRHDHPGLPLV